jgi:chemotaxis regulatin CheY-phosphate phosphatase CheZ
MSHVFYETLEKCASARVMSALNKARRGTASPRELSFLKRRGMPATQVGARAKQHKLLQHVRASTDAAKNRADDLMEASQPQVRRMAEFADKLRSKGKGSSPQLDAMADNLSNKYLGRVFAKEIAENDARGLNAQILGNVVRKGRGLTTDEAMAVTRPR